MKSSTILGLGAVGVVILTATAVSRFWLPHGRSSSTEVMTPIATPPGITLQPVSPGGSSVQQINFADTKGMTLYTYARDTVGSQGVPAVSACIGDCAKTWRPVLAAQDTEGATDWSLLQRADGSKQWCYRGAPLYRFADDAEPGDIKGQNVSGGDWRAAAFMPEVGMALPDSITVRHLPDAGGTALTTLEGLTLYAFEENPAPPVPAQPWQPLEAGAIANPTGDFTVIARVDGIMQWAYRNHPLYLFTGDRKPGEVRGIGVDNRLHVALVRRYFMPADATIHWVTGLGSVLATRSGATLYERDRIQPGEDNHDFHADHGPPALGRWYGTSTCDASCARMWPPYAAPADAVPSGYWEVLARPDGSKQWAYKGYALYRYSGDTLGEARGNRLYEIVRIDDVGPEDHTVGTTNTPLQLSAQDEAAYVRIAAPGNAAGMGVGALFWHAVVP